MYYAKRTRFSVVDNVSWVECWVFNKKRDRDNTAMAITALYPCLKSDTEGHTVKHFSHAEECLSTIRLIEKQ